MKIYLVGGAVRDQLLGLPVKEKDWVVVGTTPAEMLKLGFRQVGKDFPVFLHPKTQEEYALARTERKVGRGYTGFTFNTSPNVTLEDDLKRRDLTINAMAETPEGEIVDPYHGASDLKNKILRHVSPAFSEDPVRVLRVARFAARFRFTVAPETLLLMKEMVENGEVDALVPERVFKELDRALAENFPQEFFHVLQSAGADKVLFPSLTSLSTLEKAILLSNKPCVRFAALTSTLSLEDYSTLCERYRLPTEYRELGEMVIKYFERCENIEALSDAEIVELLLRLDVFRREARFQDFLLACQACGLQSSELLQRYYQAAKNIDVKQITEDKSLSGKAIADKIFEARTSAIASLHRRRGNP